MEIVISKSVKIEVKEMKIQHITINLKGVTMKNQIKSENPDQQPQSSHLEMEVAQLKERLAAQTKKQDELDMSAISDFLPAKKAAALLSISLVTLYKFARTGVLKKHLLGRKTYYRRSEIMSAFVPKSGDSTNV